MIPLKRGAHIISPKHVGYSLRKVPILVLRPICSWTQEVQNFFCKCLEYIKLHGLLFVKTSKLSSEKRTVVSLQQVNLETSSVLRTGHLVVWWLKVLSFLLSFWSFKAKLLPKLIICMSMLGFQAHASPFSCEFWPRMGNRSWPNSMLV